MYPYLNMKMSHKALISLIWLSFINLTTSLKTTNLSIEYISYILNMERVVKSSGLYIEGTAHLNLCIQP